MGDEHVLDPRDFRFGLQALATPCRPDPAFYIGIGRWRPWSREATYAIRGSLFVVIGAEGPDGASGLTNQQQCRRPVHAHIRLSLQFTNYGSSSHANTAPSRRHHPLS